MYIPKIDYYLKSLTDKEVKDFVAINVTGYFKSIREYLKKVAKSLYIFLTTPDEVENMYNQILLVLVYITLMLKFWIFLIQIYNWLTLNQWLKKLKELLIELKKFKFQTILVLDYKKRNDRKIFHSSAKLIVSGSDIDEAFKSMHQSVIAKMRECACKNWTALDVVIKCSIKIFECL